MGKKRVVVAGSQRAVSPQRADEMIGLHAEQAMQSGKKSTAVVDLIGNWWSSDGENYGGRRGSSIFAFGHDLAQFTLEDGRVVTLYHDADAKVIIGLYMEEWGW